MSFNDADNDGSPFISMMGIQNALRTGNMVVDVVIAMCVPIVLKIVFIWVEKFGEMCDLELLLSWFEKKSVTYERFISHVVEKKANFSNSYLDEDSQNAVLHKAIKIYLHQVVNLDLVSAYMDLTMMKEEACNGDDDDSDDEYDDDSYVGSTRTVAGQLSRYKIVNGLPYNQWHEIGRFGKAKGLVQLRIKFSNTIDGCDESQPGGQSTSMKNTTFHFISNEKDAIDAFVDGAYKWYLGMLRKMEDNSRFYFEMKVPEMRMGSGNGGQSISYKQYKLSEEKTFESLFFREKEGLLALIDHFSAKTGKYGIKGYPHKLGLLLHGPPGTGKTSLIKALAQYTGRSIVNVPLSRVSTNSELMSVFFDNRFRLEDSYQYVTLDFNDVIYVMEDCDAASHVVKKRIGESPAELGTLESITLPIPKSLWRMLLESTETTCQKVVKSLLEVSERLKDEAEKERPKVLCSIAKSVNEQPALGLINRASDDPLVYRAFTEAIESADATKKQQLKLDEILTRHAKAILMLLESGAAVNDEFIDELLGEKRSLRCHLSSITPQMLTHQEQPKGSMGSQPSELLATLPMDGSFTDAMKESSLGASFFKPNPDALSLSGLLNVLDGVVDTPGRIVILTSNHPELLDPALIRPGRVDKTLKLGYMEAPDIVKMLELYYQTTLTSSDVARVVAAVGGLYGDAKSKLRMTPAQIEQLTAEHDVLGDMIRLLEEKSPSLPTTKTGLLETEQHISNSRI